MKETELANCVYNLAKACEAVSILLADEQARRLKLAEDYADLLDRFNAILSAQQPQAH
jgi:hypothetical protein